MKVFFAIVSCHKNATRREAIRETWLSTLKEDCKFFLGKGNSELKEDEIQLEVSDKYEGLPEKVQAIFKWALERGYEYICKVDDDVYLVPDRLLKSDFDRHPYSGRINKWRAPAHPKSFLSGFTYWISAAAAQIIVDAQLDPLLTFEDRWVGGILGRFNIEGFNSPLYKVMSLMPKHQWHLAIKENYGSLCQFEPEDMRYMHGIMTGVISCPPPRTVRTVAERYNPRHYRLKRR